MKTVVLVPLILLITACSSWAQDRTLFPIEQGGKAGYIDRSGKIVIKPRFDEARTFSESLAPVRVNGDWGYVDQTGKFVIKPQFFQADKFSEGRASVGVYFKDRQIIDSRVGFYGYIDRTGALITDQHFGVAFGFSEGVAQVLTEDNQHGFINRSGAMVLSIDSYDNYFKNDRTMFKTNGNMPDTLIGYYDKSGQVKIPPKYSDGEDFSEGLACVYHNQNAGVIDTNGRLVIGFNYDYCRSFSEGLAAVSVNGKWGFIDKTGKMVIEPQYGQVEGFSDGMAVVAMEYDANLIYNPDSIPGPPYHYGAIDKTGKIVVPLKYSRMGNFTGGLASVTLTDPQESDEEFYSWGYIDQSGQLVWRSR